MTQRVNYDEIASTYDARYSGGLYSEVLEAMFDGDRNRRDDWT